jgi:hypothetical protein
VFALGARSRAFDRESSPARYSGTLASSTNATGNSTHIKKKNSIGSFL